MDKESRVEEVLPLRQLVPLGLQHVLAMYAGAVVGAGVLAAECMGMVHFDEVARADWLSIVRPFYFGAPTWSTSAALTMVLVAMVTVIESTGVFLGLGKICDKPIHQRDIVRGLRAEGLAQILGGIFNSLPYTTFSQNVGLVALTRVRSRYVIVTAGLILISLGLLPKFAALSTIIPQPVLGGAMLVMFGMVAISGVKMLAAVDFTDPNNMLIAACSISIGLGVSMVPHLFERVPEVLKIFFESSIVIGSLVAVILNAALNWRSLRSNEAVLAPVADDHFI